MQNQNLSKFDFNEAAKNWDTPERINRAKVVAESIASALPTTNKTLSGLEFGCGTGLVSFFLKDHFEQIHMVDTAAGMIEVLAEKMNHGGYSHMKPYVCDVMVESDDLQTYDCIYTSMTMHHIPDTLSFLKRFHGLLKPNGKLFLIDLDEEDGSFHADEVGYEGHNGFNQTLLKQQMAEVGFVCNESRIIFRGKKERKAGNLDYALFMATGLKA